MGRPAALLGPIRYAAENTPLAAEVCGRVCPGFVGICAFLIYKERETLSRLGNPGQNAQAALVYTRWLELTPQTGVSRESCLAGWPRSTTVLSPEPRAKWEIIRQKIRS